MKKAGDVLKTFMLRLVPEVSEKKDEISLMEAWGKDFAVEYAECTEITLIEKHKILIQVEHPAWLQRLNEDKETILKTIHTLYPSLKSIRTLQYNLKK